MIALQNVPSSPDGGLVTTHVLADVDDVMHVAPPVQSLSSLHSHTLLQVVQEPDAQSELEEHFIPFAAWSCLRVAACSISVSSAGGVAGVAEAAARAESRVKRRRELGAMVGGCRGGGGCSVCGVLNAGSQRVFFESHLHTMGYLHRNRKRDK